MQAFSGLSLGDLWRLQHGEQLNKVRYITVCPSIWKTSKCWWSQPYPLQLWDVLSVYSVTRVSAVSNCSPPKAYFKTLFFLKNVYFKAVFFMEIKQFSSVYCLPLPMEGRCKCAESLISLICTAWTSVGRDWWGGKESLASSVSVPYLKLIILAVFRNPVLQFWPCHCQWERHQRGHGSAGSPACLARHGAPASPPMISTRSMKQTKLSKLICKPGSPYLIAIKLQTSLLSEMPT